MSNFLLTIILFSLIVGLICISRLLVKIKKAREMSAHDYKFIKEIIVFLGRKGGYFDGTDKR